MTVRRWAWAGGLLAAGLLASLVRWPADSGGLGSLVVLVLAVLAGLLIELLAAFRGTAAAAPAPAVPPEGARPADGRVEVLPLDGVRSVAYEQEPGFGRFAGLDRDGPPTARPRRETPPRLLGKVALFSLFVGRDGAGWSDDEIARARKGLIRAGEWVEREAIRWGVPANVALAGVDFVADDDAVEAVEIAFQSEGDDEGPLEAFALEKALASASRASARLGFADVADLAARVGPRVSADVCVWLLHLRRAGRSIAAAEADSGLPGVDLAVCYAREASFPEPLTGPPYADPVTIIHELLHLFGASDKYGVSLATFPAGSVTERDVMCLEFESLSRLRVDPLTAVEIGWASSPDDRPAGEAPPRPRPRGRPGNGRRPPGPSGRGGRRGGG